MKITDKAVLKELRRVNCCELEEFIREYPEDEREGRSDMQVFADELSYIFSLYDEGETAHAEDLDWAKRVMRETKNGTVLPVIPGTFQPRYTNTDIYLAQESIKEYRRLRNCLRRLKKKGIYGRFQ